MNIKSQRGFRKKEPKAVLKTRVTKMDAADEGRNLEGSALEDTPVSYRGIHVRAPGRGVMDSDITTQSFGETQSDGKRERAPARGLRHRIFPLVYSRVG